MPATLEINDNLFNQMDRELSGLAMLSRMPAIKKGIHAGMKVTEARYEDYVPRSTNRKEGKHLVQTIGSKVKEYPSGTVVGVVGASFDEGAHGHLLEEGFRIVVGGTASDNVGKGRKIARKSKRTGIRGGGKTIDYVEGRHYLASAVKDTESERNAAMLSGMKAAIEEAKKV